MKHRVCLAAIRAGVLVVLSGFALAQSFTGLGDLSGGSFNSTARGVSNGGATAVGVSASSASSSEAFRWTLAGGMQPLPWFGQARAISADNRVIVGTQGISDPRVAVRWTQSGGVHALGYLKPAHTQSDAVAVNADGSVIVGSSGKFSVSPFEAFRWTQAGGMQGLGFLPGLTQSSAEGVSGDGSIVVGNAYLPGSGAAREAFRWTQADGMVGLGFMPGDNASGVSAISADGSTIVGSSFVLGVIGSEPFRWTQAGGMESLGSLPGFSTYNPLSVSHDGSIVVGVCFSNGTGITRAFIWTATTGMRLLADALSSDYGLDSDGWLLIYAFAVSADGRAIAGYGIDPDGLPQAWLAILSTSDCDPCDLNCDGSVNQFDIQPLIQAISTHAGCSACAGDTDGNGTTNTFDINGFLDCIIP